MATFSRGIVRIPHIASFLQAKLYLLGRGLASTAPAQLDAVVGWGNKPNTAKAQAYARQHELPYYRLEDGFLRSFDLGVNSAPPLSLILDKRGIYYDASQPSDLEQLILGSSFTDSETAQAETAKTLILQHQLSKYNKYTDRLPEALNEGQHVLVIDQTRGVVSISGAMANQATFAHMLAVAKQENPHATIWIKTHPDVAAGKKQGNLDGLNHADIDVIAEQVNPLALMEKMAAVYTVSSQMGFEALLLQKRVVTFGIPWYAGWGLSDDRHDHIGYLKETQRRAPRTVTQLFTAAYVQYCRYINPNTGAASSLLDTIAYLAKQKNDYRLLERNLVCFGLSWWKRLTFAPFFNSLGITVRHTRSLPRLQKWAQQQPITVLLWGMKYPHISQWAQQYQIKVMRVEDGFLRSAGLGSNLTPPLSLSFDDEGIYFNPQQASRLESILNHAQFQPHELDMADELIQQLVKYNLNKYNVGSEVSLPTLPEAKRRILVPGQVEDDASIRFGTTQIQTNLALLQAVRQSNPDAYIVYKPHPDVLSGNRIGHIPVEQVLNYADKLVENANISICIDAVDEIHTMTSLAGFEGLVRGKKVMCYGQPFYAGWGLTQDMVGAPSRRQQKRTRAELVAATLIRYPVYVHPHTHQSLSVLDALSVLREQKKSAEPLQRSWLGKKKIQLRFLIKLLLTQK